MSEIKIGCSARVIAGAWVGQLVAVKTIATEHDYKNFPEEGAYVRGPRFGTWVPLDCLEWVGDDPPVFPPRYDEEEDGCEDCEDLRAEIARLTAENARLSRLNGRRERQIARARLQEEGTPVTPEWLGDVEMYAADRIITQRVCSALRRAWAERDQARAIVATAPHGSQCPQAKEARLREMFAHVEPQGPCDCWKARAFKPAEVQ